MTVHGLPSSLSLSHTHTHYFCRTKILLYHSYNISSHHIYFNTLHNNHTFTFNCYLLQLYCPNGISPMGNSDCLTRRKPAATESRYSTYDAWWVFQRCFHNPPTSDTDIDYGICNVRTDVNACDCTQECTNTVRESALKVDSWRKIPCRTEESNLRQRRAGPILY